MDCDGCSWTVCDFFCDVLSNWQVLLKWLIDHAVVMDEFPCPRCGKKCKLNHKLQYQCNGSIKNRNVTKRCRYKQSLRSGTWFDNSKLSIKNIMIMNSYWLCLNHPRTLFIKNEMKCSPKTMVDWSNFCREVCIKWCERTRVKLGGPGITVELDEAKFGKRHCNKGQTIGGHWVLGGFERETKRVFVVGVPERTTETLLNVLKEWVLPGTTILSECWKSYNDMGSEDFQHFIANHSFNFVDPTTSADTQSIKQTWREVRCNLPKPGCRDAYFYGYLCEYLWKRAHPDHTDRLHSFFKTCVAVSYIPKPH